MHAKELLAGSFGPLQGPLTTLTSLAAFKARFQQPASPSTAPATQIPSQHAQEEQASLSSLKGPAVGQHSSAAGLQGQGEQDGNHSCPSSSAATRPSGRPGAEVHPAGRASQAGHDREKPRAAGENDRDGDAVSHSSTQREDGASGILWEGAADISAVRTALEVFLQKSGLSQHLRLEPSAVRSTHAGHLLIHVLSSLLCACLHFMHQLLADLRSWPSRRRRSLIALCNAQAQNTPREAFSEALQAHRSQNGHMQSAVEHRVQLSGGKVLLLRITEEPDQTSVLDAVS